MPNETEISNPLSVNVFLNNALENGLYLRAKKIFLFDDIKHILFQLFRAFIFFLFTEKKTLSHINDFFCPLVLIMLLRILNALPV